MFGTTISTSGPVIENSKYHKGIQPLPPGYNVRAKRMLYLSKYGEFLTHVNFMRVLIRSRT